MLISSCVGRARPSKFTSENGHPFNLTAAPVVEDRAAVVDHPLVVVPVLDQLLDESHRVGRVVRHRRAGDGHQDVDDRRGEVMGSCLFSPLLGFFSPLLVDPVSIFRCISRRNCTRGRTPRILAQSEGVFWCSRSPASLRGRGARAIDAQRVAEVEEQGILVRPFGGGGVGPLFDQVREEHGDVVACPISESGQGSLRLPARAACWHRRWGIRRRNQCSERGASCQIPAERRSRIAKHPDRDQSREL
jgi:hypothetical protein